MPREQKIYHRKLVAYRIISPVARELDNASKVLHRTKTKIVEEAITMYITNLKEQRVL